MTKKFYVFLICVITILQPVFGQKVNSHGTYRNPVIPGDFPDPSIIRVGEIYYAAGTTSDFGPNYPIYQSTDLVNWKQTGAVFNKLPDWTSDSFWAPELFYDNGTFYVYYTAKRKGDRVSCIGVATTKDISKGFEDKGIIVEWGNEAIDGFVFRDDDGKLYILWKAYGLTPGRPVEILASELSTDGLKMVGESFSITRYDNGWTGGGEEGQCMVKHNEYYYMFYSIGGCCDNRCSYRVMVARSKDLRSGWEQYRGNPLLQGGDMWKCPGHGTMVTTIDNRYYFLYHAYHNIDFEYIGRQGLLDEVAWDKKTGWPYFVNGSTPSVIAELPVNERSQERKRIDFTDFTSDEDIRLWQWDIKNSKPIVQCVEGSLKMKMASDGSAFLGWSPKTGDYTIETELYTFGKVRKGISVYGNEKNYMSLLVSDSKMILFNVIRGKKEILAENTLPAGEKLFVKLKSEGGKIFRFYWSDNRKDWNPVKNLSGQSVFEGSFIPQWGSGLRTGLMVEGENEESGIFTFAEVQYSF